MDALPKGYQMVFEAKMDKKNFCVDVWKTRGNRISGSEVVLFPVSGWVVIISRKMATAAHEAYSKIHSHPSFVNDNIPDLAMRVMCLHPYIARQSLNSYLSNQKNQIANHAFVWLSNFVINESLPRLLYFLLGAS